METEEILAEMQEALRLIYRSFVFTVRAFLDFNFLLRYFLVVFIGVMSFVPVLFLLALIVFMFHGSQIPFELSIPVVVSLLLLGCFFRLILSLTAYLKVADKRPISENIITFLKYVLSFSLKNYLKYVIIYLPGQLFDLLTLGLSGPLVFSIPLYFIFRDEERGTVDTVKESFSMLLNNLPAMFMFWLAISVVKVVFIFSAIFPLFLLLFEPFYILYNLFLLPLFEMNFLKELDELYFVRQNSSQQSP